MLNSEEHHHLKRTIDDFKTKTVTYLTNVIINDIVRNKHMHVQKRRYFFYYVEALQGVLILTYSYHIVKINIIYV